MKYELSVRSLQEIGQRANQEDTLFPASPGRTDPEGLFILCDGMGGHEAGEVASQTVCEAMSRYIAAHPREDGLFDENDFRAALDAAYDALDARDAGGEKKMGTSRIYHIRPSENKVLFVTRDHSLVNDLVSLGELTPEEARTSKQKNIITRAMQPNQEHRMRADWKNITDVRPGDYFYMCSDGMLEQSGERELLNILSMDRTDDEKIAILKGATAGNRDNHSAHLIRVVSVNAGKRRPVVSLLAFLGLLIVVFFLWRLFLASSR